MSNCVGSKLHAEISDVLNLTLCLC